MVDFIDNGSVSLSLRINIDMYKRFRVSIANISKLNCGDYLVSYLWNSDKGSDPGTLVILYIQYFFYNRVVSYSRNHMGMCLNYKVKQGSQVG